MLFLFSLHIINAKNKNPPQILTETAYSQGSHQNRI
jgi:hypothetical protein